MIAKQALAPYDNVMLIAIVAVLIRQVEFLQTRLRLKSIMMLLSCGVLVSLCSSCFQVRATQPVEYRYIPGRTALLKNGIAHAPPRAPRAVVRALAAGNELQGKPYVWGGGHASRSTHGYDCSGAASYVLRRAGLLRGSLTSRGFLKYGSRNSGDWITVYCNDGHVFLTIAGLRLDTGGGSARTGPRWKPQRRGVKGFYMRHPSGY